MKNLMAMLTLTLATTLVPGSALAHCGSCGVGGEDATQEECATKCADAADDSACEQECLEKHETEHEKTED